MVSDPLDIFSKKIAGECNVRVKKMSYEREGHAFYCYFISKNNKYIKTLSVSD